MSTERLWLALALAIACAIWPARLAADEPAEPVQAGPVPEPDPVKAAEPVPLPEAVPPPQPQPPPQPTAAPRPAANPSRGAALYRQRCAQCHGRRGRGDGSISRELDPPPRDLTRGTYKLRSTPSGSLPSDDDLFRTITRGMPGTAMFGWSGLPAADRWQLVFHLKSLSPKFARKPPRPPVAIPAPPPVTGSLVARGAVVYDEMKCADCHGTDGRGDGPAARTLKDDSKRRIYPFDMTRGWKLKAGNTPTDLFRVLHTGLDGTPMPSYQGMLSVDDAWALIAYVRSLFRD